jgi:two-component system KDP operon response regulator KdpE
MKGLSVLVIDDEIQIRRLLKLALENEGLHFFEASSGEEGLKEVASRNPDLVLLDLGLPGMQGIQILKKIREWSEAPIIILTVQNDEGAKVEALDSGADDYITKPFGMEELRARIRTAIRHKRKDKVDTIFRSGDLEVNISAHLVKRGNQEIHLTALEFSLLAFFIRHQGRVVTHQQILKEVWGSQQEFDPQYVRIYVGALRKKLEADPSNPTLIITESGIGYRLKDSGS